MNDISVWTCVLLAAETVLPELAVQLLYYPFRKEIKHTGQWLVGVLADETSCVIHLKKLEILEVPQ